MIVAILKENIDGKWRDVIQPLYAIGDEIHTPNGKTYEVTQVNGSKVTLEEKS